VTTQFDIIIIGSGAGGSTLVHALAKTSARILILERGDFVPQEDENWNATEVWKNQRYRAREQWRDERGRLFTPYTHYCVGGNTRFWGSALFRLRREDFEEITHLDGVSPAWPIDYDTLAPYYDRAERLYHVHGQAGLDPTEPARGPFPLAPIPHSSQMAETVNVLRRQGLHPFPLPLGLIRPGEAGGCQLCATCNSFPCKLRMKGDAQSCCLDEAVQHSNVTLWTNAHARRLVTDARGKQIEAVEIERNGETLKIGASLVVAACGAVNSAALLLRSATSDHPDGLANSSGLVGRRYMAHHATMISAFDARKRNTTVFQKTVAINDFYLHGPAGYPLGQIQSQGRTEAVTLKSETPWYGRPIPMWAWERWADRAVDWLAMSEDLPSADNRVTVDRDGSVRLTYRQNNLRPHQELVERTKQILKRVGFGPIVKHSLGTKNTTHQCGTLCFGTESRQSVLDPFCRAHDIPNLFVVDASFFPSSAAVNPGLTIIAQALRVADHIKDRELR
jgi:choline dehydrogenase-like flavoprotein